jgi:hypothetical protein
MMTEAILWAVGHADKLFMLAGTVALTWIGVSTWKGKLLQRIALVCGAAFWKVEQRMVKVLKEASKDGLTLAEGKMVLAAGIAEAKSLLSLGWLGRLLAAVVGVDAGKWIEAHLEGLAATKNKSSGALPLALKAPTGSDR